MIKVEGFDDCITGVCCRCGQVDVLLYDSQLIIQKLMSRDGMTWEQAELFYCVDIAGAWSGEDTPAFKEPYIEGVDEIHSVDVVEVEAGVGVGVGHNRRAGDSL